MSEAQHTTDAVTFPTNPLADLTGIQRDLLVAIDDVEIHGSPRDCDYAVPTGQCIREVVERQGHETTNTLIYTNLDELAESGYVEKEAADRRTNGYTLTGKGAEVLSSYSDFVAGE